MNFLYQVWLGVFSICLPSSTVDAIVSAFPDWQFWTDVQTDQMNSRGG